MILFNICATIEPFDKKPIKGVHQPRPDALAETCTSVPVKDCGRTQNEIENG